MTREYREYAKSRIEYLLKISRLDERDKEALEAAIQALENHDTFMKYAYSQGKHDALSQEPCDDAISRKKAICVISACDGKSAQIEALEQLPPVTQKSGKWIGIDEEPHEDYECSCCGYVVSTFTANIEPHTEYKYCPSCGAKMESEDKECTKKR